MLLNLTITSTNPALPASDLSFLLHKHPDKLQTFDLSVGKAHIFYPEVSAERCTMSLLLEIDPVTLVRGRDAQQEGLMDQYVNDRPYVASSFMSVALTQLFRSTLAGKCKDKPELPDQPFPVEIHMPVLPCRRGGETLLRRLFEPLGYAVKAQLHPLGLGGLEQGRASHYYAITLNTTARLMDVLAHLYVLIPVLDDEKHYFIADDEVEKLLRLGQGWLSAHPEREQITHRYLARREALTRQALRRLTAGEVSDPEALAEAEAEKEANLEARVSLNTQRLSAVVEVLKQHHIHTVADLGCGEGRLIRMLLGESQFKKITGMDVSMRSLELAHDRLKVDRMEPAKRERLTLLQGSLLYFDERLVGHEAITLVEVIEHLELSRLKAVETVVWGRLRPRLAVVTTPNREYNVLFEGLAQDTFRHNDHRFEWSRAEFEQWSKAVAARWGYEVHFQGVGPADPERGSPTQLAFFTRGAPAHA